LAVLLGFTAYFTGNTGKLPDPVCPSGGAFILHPLWGENKREGGEYSPPSLS
jgi:hypothetical protein